MLHAAIKEIIIPREIRFSKCYNLNEVQTDYGLQKSTPKYHQTLVNTNFHLSIYK